MQVVENNMDTDENDWADMADQVTIGRDARFNFLLPKSAKK